MFFNQYHKKTRNVAERTFGVTKSSFRCLLHHRTLHYYTSEAGTIINAVCTLHNLCIAHNDTFEILVEEVDDFHGNLNN